MPPKLHEYPGVNLPLRHLRQDGRLGVDYFRVGSFEGVNCAESELLQVREVAMMILMDRLTDKPNWHEKVFDDEIVAKWRAEALSQPEDGIYNEIVDGKPIPMPKRTRIISPEAFDCCIAELRCKARHFRETGLIFTLNRSHNTAIKSDSVVSDEARQGLQAAFEKLRAEQAAEPDWHPWTDDKVQDLVHPSMYPFVYGRTRFIHEEVVGVADAVDKWSGKGGAPVQPSNAQGPPSRAYAPDPAYWSKTYQWLPANVAFQEDGTVRFTSYVNNLHPKKHAEIYGLLEKLIDTAIPAWDRVLSGVAVFGDGDEQVRFGPPPEVDWDNANDVWEKLNPDIIAAHEADAGPVEYSSQDVEYLSDNEDEEAMSDEEAKRAHKIQRLKWKRIRDPLLPEPLPRVKDEEITYQVRSTLREKFKDNGLQVIVKIASIELTPEKPDFPAGGWHIEGMMNEHIVATALYYVDSYNVTPSRLSFRMATSYEQDELQGRVGQDMYGAYERIYGTGLAMSRHDSATVQPYGSVATPEGRLLAFPNVFQHRVSSFALQDRARPGHRRFVALWLVDPHQRVISTANVPPQRLDWWAEATFGADSRAARGDLPPELFQVLMEQGAAAAVRPTETLLAGMRNRLPAEVLDMVRRESVVPDGLMTPDEARRHRLALMEERSAFVRRNEREWQNTYSFCEH